ncbi:Acid tolerance regulatory protein ActR [Rubrivivax sp. A210]|uniref:response regulator transcription factor n=1 Tax=Rubrivivax sp. A210 TaxID=2772301 RepID=UPI0019A50B82|nr:response regulator transcription factor [Rubrivivax sp. A210]CAD5369804.1 Acid tolerance regulatory protein ActR [Rubrivivax sp. A210]
MANPQPERPSLLLVDDDVTFCQVLARALEVRGFTVDVAHDGATAMRRITAAPPEYAVLDLRLQDMSGIKLIEHLKAADEYTNIIVLTGYGSIATAVEAIKHGATYYLTKPTTADQIVAAFGYKGPSGDVAPSERPLSVDRLEWEHIQRVLSNLDGNISAAARALNMHRRTLQRKLNKFPPKA